MNVYSDQAAAALQKAAVYAATTSAHASKAIVQSSNVGWTTSLWIGFGAVLAALVTMFLGRQIKISEFRQAWINDLRADISEYISKADEWVDSYLEANCETDQEKKAPLIKSMNQTKYHAFRIFRRIELRFKPDDKDGNELLADLLNLLNPKMLPEHSAKAEWKDMADAVILKARQILKKEWEVTKNPYSSRL
jgi:hypothetical protein